MPNPTRESIFGDASRRLRSEFDEIRNNVPHHGEAGGEGETILRNFLDSHLPGRFRTASGFIIDKTDVITGHTDVIIYDALNCPVYRTSERGMIIPNDNVAAVCEVKFNLTTTLLDSALDKIHEAKYLVKTPLQLQHQQGDQIETYGMIFAFECNLSFETIVNRWHAKLTEQNPLHRSCSLIAILDRGIYVTFLKTPDDMAAPVDLQGISPAPIGTKVGIGYLGCGQGTLDEMIRILLVHLTFFRHRIDHPGFEYGRYGPSQVKVLGEYTSERHLNYFQNEGST